MHEEDAGDICRCRNGQQGVEAVPDKRILRHAEYLSKARQERAVQLKVTAVDKKELEVPGQDEGVE